MAFSLFLLGTNYQNNLMLLLCYLLLSIMLLALFYTHQNFSYLALKALTVDPFHCHQTGQLVLQVTPHRQHKNKYVNGQLLVSWLTLPRTHPVVVELNHKATTFLLDNTGSQTLCIPLSYETRGLHRLPRVTLACDFPLGLFKCWTHLDFDSKVLVYPQPIEGEVNYALTENDEENSATSLQFSTKASTIKSISSVGNLVRQILIMWFPCWLVASPTTSLFQCLSDQLNSFFGELHLIN